MNTGEIIWFAICGVGIAVSFILFRIIPTTRSDNIAAFCGTMGSIMIVVSLVVGPISVFEAHSNRLRHEKALKALATEFPLTHFLSVDVKRHTLKFTLDNNICTGKLNSDYSIDLSALNCSAREAAVTQDQLRSIVDAK